MTWTPDLRGLRNVLQRNLLLKVFSLVFAIGLWAFVNLGARDAEKTLVVPVELRNVPPDFVVTSPLVEAIDVRVRGPRTILGTIDEGRLGVRLDLSKARPGTTSFTVDPERLSLPRGLRVTRLSPVDVPLTVERLMTRRVAVKMNPGTVVPEGLRLLEPQIRPETVSVTAPESEVPKLERVITTPLELSAEAGDFERLVAIERPSPLSKVVPERVTVRGRLEEIVASKKYEQVE
ncbi:MAG: CdaR family protein, partial [Candidatus Binatia bacterium]